MTDQRWKRQKGTKIGSQTANESRGAEEVGDQKRGMERFPVEVIGNILSHVANVKDVVRASMTCRKWREALRHLHTLQQDQYSDRSFYNRKSKTLQLEFLLTDIVLQTMGLQTLRILHGTKFSGTAVIAWLSHTGGSLRHLTYEVPMSTLNVNMLERCGKMRYLESLRLRHTDIRLTTDPTAQRFMCLLSLTLYNLVDVTTFQLQSLVSACRKLESFSLVKANVIPTNLPSILNLRSSSLKSVLLDHLSLSSVILEATLLETLSLSASNLLSFKLVKKGARLSSLKIASVRCLCHFDIGNNTDCLDLQEVEVQTSCYTVWATIKCVLSKPSSKLRKLQLRSIPLNDDLVNLNPETIAFLFPRLSHLALSYEMMKEEVEDPSHPRMTVENRLQGGSTVFEKLRFLELGCHEIDDKFLLLIDGVVNKCPNLIELLVTSQRDSEIICGFLTSFVKVVNLFSHVDIKFTRAFY